MEKASCRRHGHWGRQITLGSGGNSKTWSSSVFVLDITDPASPKLLWERPLPDNTLTPGTPAVVRLSTKTAGGDPINDTENGTWYVVFGSGPTAVGTNTVSYKSSNAKIHVFNLRTGSEIVSGGLDIGASGVAVGDMMAVDMDSDYQVDDIYFGTYGRLQDLRRIAERQILQTEDKERRKQLISRLPHGLLTLSLMQEGQSLLHRK